GSASRMAPPLRHAAGSAGGDYRRRSDPRPGRAPPPAPWTVSTAARQGAPRLASSLTVRPYYVLAGQNGPFACRVNPPGPGRFRLRWRRTAPEHPRRPPAAAVHRDRRPRTPATTAHED